MDFLSIFSRISNYVFQVESSVLTQRMLRFMGDEKIPFLIPRFSYTEDVKRKLVEQQLRELIRQLDDTFPREQFIEND